MYKSHQQQSGVVLVVSLVMLLLLTLIGISGMQTTSLEEKMAGNLRDQNIAFQAAESALLAGENFVNAAAPLPAAFNCTNGLFLPYDADCDGTKESVAVWNNPTLWRDDTLSVIFNTDGDVASIDLGHTSANPRYLIEYMGDSCATLGVPCPAADLRRNYRITARATGGTNNAVIVLQSVYQIDVP